MKKYFFFFIFVFSCITILLAKESNKSDNIYICNKIINASDFPNVQFRRFIHTGYKSGYEQIVNVKENECLPNDAEILIDGKSIADNISFPNTLFSYQFKTKVKPKITNNFKIVPTGDTSTSRYNARNDYKLLGTGEWILNKLAIDSAQANNAEKCFKIINSDEYDVKLVVRNYFANIKCPDKPDISASPCKIEVSTEEKEYKVNTSECFQTSAKNSFFTDTEIYVDGQIASSTDYTELFGTSSSYKILFTRYYLKETMENIKKGRRISSDGIESITKKKDDIIKAFHSAYDERKKDYMQMKDLENQLENIEKNTKKWTALFSMFLIIGGILGFILLKKQKGD